MKRNRIAPTLAAVLLAALAASGLAAAETSLRDGFRTPPPSAKPHTWWHWVNGNVSRDGITKDLEAMKQVGVGGAQMFTVDAGAPTGPVGFMSPEWHGLVKHAISEANRLGLEICMHNCAGWSSSGGPWVTPETAMQMLVWTEKRTSGGSVEMALPQPLTRHGYYRDIAVLAFRTPRQELESALSLAPKVTGSGQVDLKAMTDSDVSTYATIATEGGADRAFVTFSFDKPFTASSIRIVPGPRRCAGAEIQISDDGREFRTVSSVGLQGSEPWITPEWFMAQSFDKVTSRFFRVLFNRPEDGSHETTIAEMELSGGTRVPDLSAKIGNVRREIPTAAAYPRSSTDEIVAKDDVIDVSSSLGADGVLRWNAPAGEWTIVRFGHTPVGKGNHPAPPDATGLECDKMSAAAVDAHFDAMMGKVIAEVGPLAGTTFNNILIDSYETGPQNWTPLFREDFKRLRGYDPILWMPALTGRLVNDRESSERFLWDFRRTISDLWAENYYGRFAELCHKNGIKLSVETYGNGNFDDLTCGRRGDIPMCEFWSGSSGDGGTGKEASSEAHTNGTTIVGAESFTSGADGWKYDPYSEKALGDLEFCNGVNRFIFHTYAHQPWTNRLPGMTMGANGLHFNRNQTWWNQSRAWLQYITRCQYMLQQGSFVADMVYYTGGTPSEGAPTRPGLQPAPPTGIDYDCCDRESLLKMTVKNGRIVLPGGMSYRILAIQDGEIMAPEVASKIRDLVAAGAMVIGPKPVKSPSLADLPSGDAQVREIADQVWGKCDGKTVTEHAFGKGLVFWGKPIEQALVRAGVKTDFEALGPPARLAYIHRRTKDADIYFISNQRPRPQSVKCAFRVTGKLPEFWAPDTGEIHPAASYTVQGGRTIVPIDLDQFGSVFVVFAKPSPGGSRISSVERVDAGKSAKVVHKLAIKRAVYGIIGDPARSVDVTKQVAAMVADNMLTLDATNGIAGDPAPNVVKAMQVDYTVDGVDFTTTVAENGELDIPTVNASPRDFQLVTDGSSTSLLVWTPGVYEVTTGSCRKERISVKDVPAPKAIAGRWTLKLPAGGGVERVMTLDELKSLSESEDPLVKYFSGTATYSTQFEVPASALAHGRVAGLDLGEVASIAEVRLNGRQLGTLWKQPFRVDVTGRLRAGTNTLEVKVTNTWVNRLIGDSGLPESARVTSTTFNPYSPDSPLVPSGLIGPVTLRIGRKAPIR